MLTAEQTFAERSLLRGLVEQLGAREGLREFLDLTGIALDPPAQEAKRAKRRASLLWASDRYAPIREAAWHYRNSRAGDHHETRHQLRDAAQALIDQGEHSAEVLDVLLELARPN